MESVTAPPAALDAAVDPFLPLLQQVDKYKHGVHTLHPPATEDALTRVAQHLGRELPLTLAGFLRRWNGASLFRGALRIRGALELAPALAQDRRYTIFADGPGMRQWAWCADGHGGFAFGEWTEQGLQPLHDRFLYWLNSWLSILDQDLVDADPLLAARLEVDPDGGYLLLTRGEQALAGGDPDRAVELLRRANATHPHLTRAWQRLGEIQLLGDPAEARFALLRALRASRLPIPFRGLPAMEAEALGTLAGLFPAGDPAWDTELQRFLEEAVTDAETAEDLAFFEAAALAQARTRLARLDRHGARDALARALERARAFQVQGLLVELRLALVALHTDLGEHDEAEDLLRQFRGHPDPLFQARCRLGLGRLAVSRQEPWAEEILTDALRHLDQVQEQAQAVLLLGERHLRKQRPDRAAEVFRKADALAVAAGDLGLQAAVCVGMGDAAWAQGDLERAQQAWSAAAERAREGGSDEVLLRLRVREGDLAAARGEPDQACDAYSEAFEGYRALQLPVRQAWAGLRLSRLSGDPGPAQEAWEAFARADVAVGIGAADAVLGDPTRSLDWHLARSAEHARIRLEAQRARPPRTRADAERPERRLGGHRLAISGADPGLVRLLAAQLTQRARALNTARARPTDPDVSAYTAAVNLLAWHRSVEAADALLDQLRARKLPEWPARALRGALTRSPNAALVDGLLRTIEQPGEPRGVAAAAEILGWRREQSAVAPLLSLLGRTHSPQVRREAVVALGRIGDRDAVDALVALLDEADLAEELAVSLLLLGDRRGVDFHGQALASGLELASPPGEIVGRYGGPSYLLLLMRTAEGSGSRAMGALQGLGYLGDPRAVPVLLAALGHKSQDLVAVAASALELLTGHREDPDQPGLSVRWERWWELASCDFTEGVRYRYGRVLDLALLVEKLGDDDLLVRRGSYDELVISSGCRLPFDADGPWRVQLAHRKAWLEWVRGNRQDFPPGRWYYDSCLIG